MRAAALSALLALAAACGAPPPAGPALQTVTLPDLASAAPPVQQQIRQQFATLQQNPRSADANAAMGRLFIAAEYYDAAAACFENAQALEPDDMRWPYYLGHVERLRNQPAKAAARFERALALDANHVPSLVWLGAMRLVAGDADEAEAPIDKALALAPNDAAALYQAGRVALAKRDYPRAVARLTAALAAEPRATAIHYPLSLAYRGAGDVAAADRQLALRGDVDPAPDDPLMRQVASLLRNATAFEVRGADALANRQWPEAVDALRQALALAPDNAVTHLNLGTALFQTGDAPGALAEYREAARLQPGLAKAHYGAGVVEESAGRDAAAIAAFTAAVNADPAMLEAHLSLADALRRTGGDADAVAHYKTIIAASPSASAAHFGLAMALVRLRRWADARDVLTTAAATFPEQPGFAHALARVLAAAPDDRVRDGRRALAIVDDLLKKAGRTPGLMQTMAMALAETGRFDEAVRWQRDAASAAQGGGAAIADNLSRYERRLPCRTPWPDDDPVFRPRPGQ